MKTKLHVSEITHPDLFIPLPNPYITNALLLPWFGGKDRNLLEEYKNYSQVLISMAVFHGLPKF